MPVQIMIRMRMTEEGAHEMRDGGFSQTFAGTRAFGGCEWIHAYQVDGSTTEFVIFEQWQSHEHYQRYIAWRKSTGYLEQSASRYAERPSMTTLTLVD